MRLAAIPLIVLSVTIFSEVTKADDTPKRSPELQVLDHFAGTWKADFTGKAGDQPYTETSFVTREWSTDGQFLLEHDKLKPDDRVTRTRGVWTYDPDSKSYRLILTARNWAILSNCQWNETTKTMTFRTTDHDGNVGTSSHWFPDKDHAEWSAVMKDDDGKVIWEGSCKLTRLKTKTDTP